ncbi:DNA polymerase ligase N-terminal domain-containing protein [Kineococcus sp. SYSU DK003]|uniref:DNA polymerase ligase N-terminal domain-containing protein n=1 Tax=Kineococcus sp. SYSU DK003 TaxID=3383124 RepID=UPI003D7CD986
MTDQTVLTDQEGTASPGGDRPAFVLHDHRTPRPHHDLRLQEDGVLRSWALPRGLPTDPRSNRLAVAVSDHDLEHLGYTDADKAIADTGWWQLESRTDRRTVFVLHGRHGSRRYALIRTHAAGPELLLHLTADQPRAADP